MRQDTERQPIPQADGDGRRFNTHGLGSHVRVHVEKRGPAFDVVAQDANETELLPLMVAEQMGASLIAQHSVAVGDVLSAIRRGVLLDLMPAWLRLLSVQGVTLPQPIGEATVRGRWAYDDLIFDFTVALLSAAKGPAAWMTVHMKIRAMASDEAERSAATLLRLSSEWLQLAKTDPAWEPVRQSIITVSNNMQGYQAFAAGNRDTAQHIAAIERMEAIYQDEHNNTRTTGD